MTSSCPAVRMTAKAFGTTSLKSAIPAVMSIAGWPLLVLCLGRRSVITAAWPRTFLPEEGAGRLVREEAQTARRPNGRWRLVIYDPREQRLCSYAPSRQL